MYNEQSIATLVGRIGWEKPLDSDFVLAINEEVLSAASERKVNSFHQLATIENVYAAVPVIDMEADSFSGFLSSIQKQSVQQVLTAIFDQHSSYLEAVDYSEIIVSRPRIFDDAIGYCIAIKMLELFVSSKRSNLHERSAKLSFQSLKLELEGVRNDGGFYVAQGIKYEMKSAITKAQKVIFPLEVIVKNGNPW
jgi:uncharacterized Rmd1/YagE family protein